MSNRDELISKLEQRFHEPYEHGASLCNLTIEDVADFIIERERNIVEPLKKHKDFLVKTNEWGKYRIHTTIDEVLSGVSNGKG